MEEASLPFPTAGLPSSADLPHDAFPMHDDFPTCDAFPMHDDFPTCDVFPMLIAATGAREREQHQGQVSSEVASVTTSL